MNQILSRSERRAMERAKEKHIRNLVAGGYGQWKEITNDPHTIETMAKVSVKPSRVWVNGLFIVQEYLTPNAWGAVRVMIRFADARPDHDWGLFQRIKNDLYGPERVALEVYPSEYNKQDVANMYWLWVLPEGFDCPIEMRRKA